MRGVAEGKVNTAFIFSGQGSQYVGMGRALFLTEPRFRGVLLQMEAHWRSAQAEIDTLLDTPSDRQRDAAIPPSLIDDVLGYSEDPPSTISGAVEDSDKRAKSAEEYIHNTRYAQPALLALEWALAQLLQARGIQPTARC